MLLAAGLPAEQMIILGLLLLVTAFVLRRNRRLLRRRSGQSSQPAALTHHELPGVERTAAKMIGSLEVRLHDLSRDLEARLHDRTIVLDHLLHESELKLAELRKLLDAADETLADRTADQSERHDWKHADRELTSEEIRMMGCLYEAGFSQGEIARCFTLPMSTIQRLLGTDDSDETRTAA